MRKILYVAVREFSATVMTKGFVLGMLVTPALTALMVFVLPRVMSKAPPKIEGEVAIIDLTGAVSEGFSAYLTPERFAERRTRARQRMEEAAPEALRSQAAGGEAVLRQSLDAALGEVPRLHVTVLPATAAVGQAKAPLRKPLSAQEGAASSRLALAVVRPNAVRPADGTGSFGGYALFVRDKLDDRLIDDLHAGLKEAIIAARLRAAGVAPGSVRELTTVERPDSLTVTAEGERRTSQTLNMLVPMGFMLLLLVSVLTSGQYLLTTTVEEKSNRVVEVLLSAISSMELMTGKILGQVAVGFLVLAVYGALGLAALVSFATVGLLDPVLIVYLLIFYVLAAFTYSALMAAIGSAVNEMREAQTLMMPVMLLVLVPWLLWLPISRDPHSALAVVLSFIPPVGNFVMLLRLAASTPPPAWQTWLAIFVSAGGVFAALWFAAKVFRVGLLMYGKPPTLGTLVRWARMS